MNRRVLYVFCILIVPFLFCYCSRKNSEPEKAVAQSDSNKSVQVAGANNDSRSNKSNFELLQGRWQSTDDETNFLVFDKNKRKEISEGMDSWDEEEFVLADKCMNESNKYQDAVREKDRYISVLKSDMSWYIIRLDSDTLSLSYMGRGNTLTYKRVR